MSDDREPILWQGDVPIFAEDIDATPNDELRELLAELREIEQKCADTDQWGECVGYANSANKLEELLNE